MEIKVQLLYIYGALDKTISPKKYIRFFRKYQNAGLQILSEANHVVSVLMDDWVEFVVCDLLTRIKLALLYTVQRNVLKR